jgi:hypothetical protein
VYNAGSNASFQLSGMRALADLAKQTTPPSSTRLLLSLTFHSPRPNSCRRRVRVALRRPHIALIPPHAEPFHWQSQAPLTWQRAMSDETETPAQPRTSRFREHTNTANSIKPPPEELWKELDIEDMLDKFNEENSAPPARKGLSKSITPPAFGVPATMGHGVTVSTAQATPATSEGTFGRFSRAFASVFGGFGSVLGKRKAGNADSERDRERQMLDDRKLAAEQAYEARKLAQEMGLMPTPKVFVRPTATPRSHKCGMLLRQDSMFTYNPNNSSRRPSRSSLRHTTHPITLQIALKKGPPKTSQAHQARLGPRAQTRLRSQRTPHRPRQRRASCAPDPRHSPHPRTKPTKPT